MVQGNIVNSCEKLSLSELICMIWDMSLSFLYHLTLLTLIVWYQKAKQFFALSANLIQSKECFHHDGRDGGKEHDSPASQDTHHTVAGLREMLTISTVTIP